jgi:ADP-ribose pyrophosphatase
MTFTVAVGVGLTDAVLGPEERHLSSLSHVGHAEAERLLGAGRDYGRGILPTFLAEFDVARRSGARAGLLLLRECGDSPFTSLVAPVVPYLWGAELIRSAPAQIPWQPMVTAIQRISGIDPAKSKSDGVLRFLVFGCHTEQTVLSVALLLRSVLGCEQVAISPYLVGSALGEAHLAVLRHQLPRAGVQVLLHPWEAASFLGIDARAFAQSGCTAFSMEPGELSSAMDDNARRMVELLCLRWSKAHLRPLSGGFSGSLLMLASGWKGESRTEPMVIKVDHFRQMRKEIDGYRMVKDLLGKHVPSFDWPVALGESLGVGMDLAAMEGAPESLQDTFEQSESDEAFDRFLRRLDKALVVLSDRLYRNTLRREWVSPYRAFHLHTDMQQQWFAQNVAAIRGHWEADTGTPLPVDADLTSRLLHIIARNDDGVESEVCLVHGDLNLKNIISDEGGNIWFIDWTHCGRMPIELDFAKMENDVKFVMSKQFELADLGRLRQFEAYLMSRPIPASPEQLPDELRFVRWDLRFRKILLSVARVRRACFALKSDESWMVYRAALLKYALHTLSFDLRQGRGECDLPQLVLALYSVEGWLNDLVVDDFQFKIRGERASSYPPRQRISIDAAPWDVECADYQPPYYVAPEVLANDCSLDPDGWADPEDFALVPDSVASASRYRDTSGRPLHPLGRTGIAGRGQLGRWGPNLLLTAIVTRHGSEGRPDILLGTRDGADSLELPQCFARNQEECAFARLIEKETGWLPDGTGAVLSEGYEYDARRTDHAWVVTTAWHLHISADSSPAILHPIGDFKSVSWFPLNADTVNRMPAAGARHARDAIRELENSGEIECDIAVGLLAATG